MLMSQSASVERQVTATAVHLANWPCHRRERLSVVKTGMKEDLSNGFH